MKKIQVNVLIEEKDVDLLKVISSKRGQNSADFIRFLIKKEFANLGLLSKKEARLLGLDVN